MKLILTAVATLVACLTPHSVPARAQQPLERVLLKQAPELIARFRERDYKNVGVLKFQVERERAGKPIALKSEFNQLLANRLETALLLSNSINRPIGIVKNATATAQDIKGAGLRDRDGRLRLFLPRYTMAWGAKKDTRPDAFVTGRVLVSKDLETLTLNVEVFDTQTNKTDIVLKPIAVANRAELLSEMGASFPFRSVFRRKNPEVGGADKYAAETKDYKPQPFQAALAAEQEYKLHPAAFIDEPVKLEVYYNEQMVPFEMKKDGDGYKAFMAEPREGDKIKMLLQRDGSKRRYAVVLKVNGENTINREREADYSCHKWVLERDFGPAVVDGYLMDRTHEPFTVLSQAASKLAQNDFGERVGTISMTVFRERGEDAPPPPASALAESPEAAERERIVATAPQLKGAPQSLKDLRLQLQKQPARGLIVPDRNLTSLDDRQRVPFDAAEAPLMNLTLFYYQKQ
jgi:hypothetical protein